MTTLSLRGRLLLMVGLLLLAIAIFLLFFYPAQVRNLAERSATRKANAMISLVARAASLAVEFKDEQAAERILQQLDVDEEVVYAILVLPGGQILGSFSRTDQAVEPPVLGFSPSFQPHSEQKGGLLHTAVRLMGTTAEPGESAPTPVLPDLDEEQGALDLPNDEIPTAPARPPTAASPHSAQGATLYLGLSLTETDALVTRSIWTTVFVCAGILILGMLVTLFVSTSIAKRLSRASVKIASVSGDIFAATQQQEAAGVEQATSVQEITQTMISLTESAKHIAESAQEVFENAEKARTTTDETAAKISDLSSHANRISEILETIRDIADRSDLLALNASLEATRAGEAGRAFSLVAAEMRRLAEHVTDSVQVVKGLVADVRGSGAASVVAIEDNRKLVESTTESSRRITMVTQQQRAVTEQISQSMHDISRVIDQSVSAIQQTRSAADALNHQAKVLEDLVGRSATS